MKIQNLESDVELTSKFGELVIDKVVSSLKGLKLDLRFSDATIDLKNLKENIQILSADNVKSNKNVSKNFTLKGNFSVKNSSLSIKGKQSKITIIKQ